jgi:hypothetical protein
MIHWKKRNLEADDWLLLYEVVNIVEGSNFFHDLRELEEFYCQPPFTFHFSLFTNSTSSQSNALRVLDVVIRVIFAFYGLKPGVIISIIASSPIIKL